MNRSFSLKWLLYIGLTLVEALAAVLWLASFPGEATSAVWLGFSKSRLILMAIPLIVGLAALATGVASFCWPPFARWVWTTYQALAPRWSVRALLFWGLTVMGVACLRTQVVFNLSAAGAARLQPLLILTVMGLAQSYLLVIWDSLAGWRFHPPDRRTLRHFAVIMMVFAGAALAGRAIGIDAAMNSGFNSSAGAPILPIQLFIAILATHALALTSKAIRPARRLDDVVTVIALIALAAWLWTHTGIPTNHFMRNTGDPTYPIYPYSDSRVYDLNAQGFWLGDGLGNGQPIQRALYSFFLAGLHAIAGQNYTLLIQLQTVVLAVLPALLYLLIKNLATKPAGILAALLLIFREQNLALLSGSLTMSSVRMLMSEAITAVFLVGAAWAMLRLAQNPGSKRRLVWAGAAVGLAALIRTQILALIAIPVLIVFLHEIKRLKKATLSALLLLAGMGLVVLPWMARNYFHSGQFVFENPQYATKTLVEASTGSYPGDENVEENSGFSQVLQVIRSNPSAYVWKTASHFTNSLLSSLYQLPWQARLSDDLDRYVINEPGQRFFPYRTISPGQGVALALYLAAIAAGLATAWKKVGLGAYIPLAMYLIYNLTTALVGFSGWRFIQPVDWVVIGYASIGLAQVIAPFIRVAPAAPEPTPPVSASRWALPAALAGALALGLLMPVSELLAPSRLQPTAREALTQRILAASPNNPALANLSALSADPNAVIEQGFAFYPIYMTPKNYNETTSLRDEGLKVRAPGLYFAFHGEATRSAILPLDTPMSAPIHAQAVVVVGCQQGAFIEVYALLAPETENGLWVSREGIPQQCLGK